MDALYFTLKLTKFNRYKSTQRVTIQFEGDKTQDVARFIAEQALGKPLPKGALVHHADGNALNNDPENLVICPDNAYHNLLHKRLRQFGYEPLKTRWSAWKERNNRR